MRIRNLTSKSKELLLRDAGNVYSVTLVPRGVTRLEGVILVNREALAGSIEIDGEILPSVVADLTEEITPSTVTPEEEKEEEIAPQSEDEEKENDQSETEEGKFLCDVCGAEFASARGLASHKSRAHIDEE